jgi:hypothetical protein
MKVRARSNLMYMRAFAKAYPDGATGNRNRPNNVEPTSTSSDAIMQAVVN